MWYAHDGPSGWGWLWMASMMALVWLPLLLVAWWLVRQIGQPGTSGRGEPRRPHDDVDAREVDAREIARRAYARGELGRERFLEITADLQRSSDGARGERDAET